MAVYLNMESALILYKELVNSEYFIDKSGMIEHMNKRIRTNLKYVCITKPRRFGKTSALNMLGAYYGKAYDSKELFDGLVVSRCKTYMTHLNQYNVIHLCLNDIPLNRNCYEDYLTQLILKRSIVLDRRIPKTGRKFIQQWLFMVC